MFLQRLVLDNVRSIEHLEISFAKNQHDIRKWTFILGNNGCGKSTILRSIALLLAGSEALPELLGNPDSWIRNGKAECLIHADLVNKEGEVRKVDLRLKRGQFLKETFEQNREILNVLDEALSHTTRNYMIIGYGVSRRLSNDKSVSSLGNNNFRNPRASSVATLFQADATLNSLEQWAMDLDYQTSGKGLHLVKSTLNDFLPEIDFEKIDKENRQLLFNTSDGIVPLSYLSDGYQNVIAWCGDLLYRVTQVFKDHKNPFDARGLLLIDEIDLHLHPLWQRKLVDFLTKKLPNFQIITTTHSAMTVHQAGEGELFLLKRETPEASPTIKQYEGSPKDLKLHQLLVSPIFGLETSDSLEVEKVKNDYRKLKSLKTLSKTESKNFERVKTEVEALPTATYYYPQEQSQLDLLAEIKSALTKK
jgi:predicted ATP-binding protein involved in virulence